jgi:hypothetical protein
MVAVITSKIKSYDYQLHRICITCSYYENQLIPINTIHKKLYRIYKIIEFRRYCHDPLRGEQSNYQHYHYGFGEPRTQTIPVRRWCSEETYHRLHTLAMFVSLLNSVTSSLRTVNHNYQSLILYQFNSRLSGNP